jgi:hypothetical protein
MTIAPFSSDKQLISFAKIFFREKAVTFRHDVDICLTASAAQSHAYFPALLLCIGFLDLLSGLHAGRLEHHGLAELKKYAKRFMNGVEYHPLYLEILYLAFRHKLAHLSVPYLVFDTATKPSYSGRPRRITWKVNAGRRKPPIEIIDFPARYMKRSLRPWPVDYNSRIIIGLRSFQIDIVKSIYGPKGFLKHLENDTSAQARFTRCLKVLYPPSAVSPPATAGKTAHP